MSPLDEGGVCRTQSRWAALSLTAVSASVTVLWPSFPHVIPFLPWGMWVWFVCCGVVLLSIARFRMRHCVPFPEFWLFTFPFAFQFFFQVICPTSRVAAVDQLLWIFDRAFGHPQVFLSKLLLSSPLLFWVCKLGWWSLPTQFVLMYLALPAAVRRRYVAAIACTGCLILPLYALCPAAGPVYLFDPSYPNAVPASVSPEPTYLPHGLLLNTTPSGHVAWTLLLLAFAHRYCSRRVAALFGAAGVITVVATLGLGEHYVIDLVLSCPYAAAIWYIIDRRWKAAAALLVFLIAWLIALRTGFLLALPAPAVWAASGATILTWTGRRSPAAPAIDNARWTVSEAASVQRA